MLSEAVIRVWETKSGEAVSILSVVTEYLGPRWAYAAGAAFIVLINCTLVSQLAKCGELGTAFSSGLLPNAVGTIVAGAVLAVVSFSRGVARINSVCTMGMGIAFGILVLVGLPGVTLQPLMVASFASAVPALPAFAQIMTYGEAIPTVVDMLRGDRQRVRRVLAIGTLTPVSMYMVWLAVTLGRAEWASVGAAGGDLANMLLASGGVMGASTGALGVFASASTVIGCFLALSRFIADGMHLPVTGSLKTMALTVVPAILVSLKGPELYYLMIKFSGCIPVVFLWGLIPPMISYVMWKRSGELTVAKQGFVGLCIILSVIGLVMGIISYGGA